MDTLDPLRYDTPADHRRLGARILPSVQERPRGLLQRHLERYQLEGRREALQRSQPVIATGVHVNVRFSMRIVSIELPNEKFFNAASPMIFCFSY